jgi:hypothetical protein
MKLTNAEILKTNTAENVTLKDRISEAENKATGEELKLHEAEEDARSLDLLLQQIEATHEKKEEAERKGKETSEKIAEISG